MEIGNPTQHKPSSKVLKPPGGGHSNIFGPPEDKPRQARPTSHQQNSASICAIMGKKEGEANDVNNVSAPASTPTSIPDPEPAPQVENSHPEPVAAAPMQESAKPTAPVGGNRGRVPPGGFSAGFW